MNSSIPNVEVYTVVVVSREDLREHQEGNELINFGSYPAWQQGHHECTFDCDLQTRDSQMRKAVREHAKKYHLPYGLNPEDSVDIYPFRRSVNVVFRPSNGRWEPDKCASHHFIYISASSASDNGQNHLLFLKFYNPGGYSGCQLRFCGTLRVRDDEIVLSRFHHLRKLCGIDTTMTVQLLDIFSATQFYFIDISKSFIEQNLRTGSIVVAQEGAPVKALREPNSGLAFPPYGSHVKRQSTSISGLGANLYLQARLGQFTDVTLLSTSDSESPFELTAHKNVLATVPYFKVVFQSGMKESANPAAIQLESPPWTTRWTMERFIMFVYLRNSSSLATDTIEMLSKMIRLSDYYGFDELTDVAAELVENKYSLLSEVNALELLTVIEPLQFKRKARLLRFVIEYLVFNFSRVARRPEFIELFGHDIYNTIIDAVFNASWEKRFRSQDI